jgi:hypothetical protein
MSEEAEGGLVENLRAKEEEVKILWNVIKEINKTKDKASSTVSSKTNTINTQHHHLHHSMVNQ